MKTGNHLYLMKEVSTGLNLDGVITDREYVDVDSIVGQTISGILDVGDMVLISTVENNLYMMHACGEVWLAHGDFRTIVGHKITKATRDTRGPTSRPGNPWGVSYRFWGETNDNCVAVTWQIAVDTDKFAKVSWSEDCSSTELLMRLASSSRPLAKRSGQYPWGSEQI